MKKIILLLILVVSSAYAHKEWVHKHLVNQAYEFLKLSYPNIVNTEMNSFMGLDYCAECDGIAYNHGTITAGAWREDCEDPVFLNSGFFNQRTTINHFWDADLGDNSKMQLCDPECWSYENAFQKALLYANGSWELNIQIILYNFPTHGDGTGGCATQWAVVTFKYNGLRDLYVNNNIYVTKVAWGSGETTTYNNPIKFVSSHWSSLNSGSYSLFLKKIVFETIGRISHLLQDMSVPAHVKNDQHPCDIWDPDAYEIFVGGNDWSPTVCNDPKSTFYAQNFNVTTALNQGGLLDIFSMNKNEVIRYLFYTQNQLADHFPSGRPRAGGYTDKFRHGDNDLPNGSNSYLMDRYNLLGQPPNFPEYTFNYQQIANETLNSSIRATATLLYWFAMELEIIPNTFVFNNFNGGNILLNGSNYSSGHRIPSWNNPSSLTLQAVDQENGNCYWRFQNWQKIQNGTVSQTFTTRSITITPTANTTYKANFTSENYFNWTVTGPLKGLYRGESRLFHIYPFYGNPPANYYWNTKYRSIYNGQVYWTDGLPDGCSISFINGGGSTATFTNNYFSKYCGSWADSVIRVYGTVQPGACGCSNQTFFEEITLKDRTRPGYPPPPPPGGCPYVYTWNGNTWIEENNILPQSQDPQLLGQDVIDYYQLYTKPVEEDGKYYLALNEYEEDRSYLDQLKLLVIDHPEETFITIDDSGTVIQFAKPAYFANAELDSNDVYKQLLSLDDIKTEVSESDVLSLSFENVNSSTEKWLLLVGQVEPISKDKVSGKMISKSNSGKENSATFSSFRLRKNPTYQWVLAPTSSTSTLQIDIAWQEEAKIDFTELSNKLELPFILTESELLSASHSTLGDIKNELMVSDGIISELNKNEWIELGYSIPPITQGMQRSFVFVSKGRYEHIMEKSKYNISGKNQLLKNNTVSSMPLEYKLEQNYPNPFNPTSTINYSVKDNGYVRLKVYDIIGNEVAELINGNLSAGNYSVEFNAGNLPSGVYIYSIQVNNFFDSKKMILIK